MHFEVQVPLLGQASRCCYDRLIIWLLFEKIGLQVHRNANIGSFQTFSMLVFCHN